MPPNLLKHAFPTTSPVVTQYTLLQQITLTEQLKVIFACQYNFKKLQKLVY